MSLDHVLHRADQQLILSASIAEAFENLNSRAITREQVEMKLEAVEQTWEEFRVNHQTITLASFKLDSTDHRKVRKHSYFFEDIFTATKDCFLETAAIMSILLNDQQVRSSRASPERSISQPPTVASFINAPRLPPIDLPKFDGTLDDWLSFRDSFTSLVLSNGNISPVEKLQYLETSLVDSDLKNIALTSNNLQEAWDSLTAVYENNRLLVDSALQSLFSLRKMTRESASEMQVLYMSVTQIYRTLETLKRPVQHWDDILVFTCVQRLDSESIKAWAHHLGASKEPPTWKQLSDFLLTRLLFLRAIEMSQSRPPFQSRTRSVYSHSTSVGSSNNEAKYACSLCTEKHHLSRCPKYRRKTVWQRRQVVRTNSLCFNCLGRHRVSNCSSRKRCSKCGNQHHSTLHKDSFLNSQRSIAPAPTHSSTIEECLSSSSSRCNTR